MTTIARLVALLLLTLSTSLFAQEASPIDAILKEGKENCQVMAHLDHLTNKIGPRLTGSDKLTQAQEWAKGLFESYGLKNVRMEEWGTFKVGFNRGPWTGTMLAPQHVELTCGTMSWTAGTDGPKSGPAYLIEKDTTVDAKKAKGAWIVTSGRPTNDAMTACEAAGAFGFVRASDSGELILTGGNHNLTWEKIPKRVTVHVIKSQHKDIVDQLKAGKAVKLQFDIKNEFKQGPIKLYNVIGEIPGTEKPDEYVIVGGHIDSWDGATGTTDNGTGTCTTIEAARILTKIGAKPKRTIRFMLWSGEEQGLLGSQAFLRKHKDELAKISAVLVHDGGTNYVSGINATAPMVPLFEKIFEPVKSLNAGLPFKVNPVKNLPYPIGSDHDSYLQAGVPGFFWNQKRTKDKGQDYNHEHHTQHDLYNTAVPEFQQHTSIVIAVGALGIANLDDLLPRKDIRGGGGGGDEPPRRMLGIQCEDDLVLTVITDDSAASRAGLKEGDTIVKLGGVKPKDLSELRDAIQKSQRDTTVTILRNGKELELKIQFDN